MTSWDISKYPHTHDAPQTDAELIAHLHDTMDALGIVAVERLLEEPQQLESMEQLLLNALQTIRQLKQNTFKIIPEEADIDLRSQPTLRLLPDSSI